MVVRFNPTKSMWFALVTVGGTANNSPFVQVIDCLNSLRDLSLLCRGSIYTKKQTRARTWVEYAELSFVAATNREGYTIH